MLKTLHWRIKFKLLILANKVLDQWVLSLSMHQAIKTQAARPHSQDSGLRWGLQICITHRFLAMLMLLAQRPLRTAAQPAQVSVKSLALSPNTHLLAQ